MQDMLSPDNSETCFSLGAVGTFCRDALRPFQHVARSLGFWSETLFLLALLTPRISCLPRSSCLDLAYPNKPSSFRSFSFLLASSIMWLIPASGSNQLRAGTGQIPHKPQLMLPGLLSQHRKSLPLSLSTATTCCEIWGWTFSVQNSEATISSSNLEGCIRKCHEKRQPKLLSLSSQTPRRSHPSVASPATPSLLHIFIACPRTSVLMSWAKSSMKRPQASSRHADTLQHKAQFMVAQKHVALNVGWDVCPRHFHLGDWDP